MGTLLNLQGMIFLLIAVGILVKKAGIIGFSDSFTRYDVDRRDFNFFKGS